MKEQIAKELADSGLFGWVKSSTSTLEIRFGGLPWPTADESEEILAAMRLQVVWDCYGFVGGDRGQGFGYYLKTTSSPSKKVSWLVSYKYKGHRTLANNAALAWLAKNRREDLEQTLKSMGKL